MMHDNAIKDLAEKYGIEVIYLFGSQAAEGDNHLKGQDISPGAISDLAKELGERGIITKDLSDVLLKMAGYRNRMVHFYKEVSNDELYSILISNLNDFDRFTKEVVVFIRAYGE